MGGAFDTYKLSKISSIKGLSFRRLSLDTPTIRAKFSKWIWQRFTGKTLYRIPPEQIFHRDFLLCNAAVSTFSHAIGSYHCGNDGVLGFRFGTE